MKINVTQDHIRNGSRGTPRDCMIALAIKEQVPKILSIEVQTHSMSIVTKENGVARTFLVPLSADITNKICTFDHSKAGTVPLDEFSMDVPDEVLVKV